MQKKDAGFVLPLAVILASVLMGLLALGVDLGRGWYYGQAVRSAADAAALAGATHLSSSASASSHASAVFLADTQNLPAGWSPLVSVSADIATGRVTVEATGSLGTAFAGVFGMNSIGIAAKSTALREGSAFPYAYRLLP